MEVGPQRHVTTLGPAFRSKPAALFGLQCAAVSLLPLYLRQLLNGIMNANTFICLMLLCPSVFLVRAYDSVVEVKVDTSKLLHTVSDRFLSITIGIGEVFSHFKTLNVSDPKVITLAGGLSPAVLRIGGTDADESVFDPSGTWNGNMPTHTYTLQDWESANSFAASAGLQLLFDLNDQLRAKDGSWDASNAEELFAASALKGYTSVWWQLGNEPNLDPEQGFVTITPDQLAKDMLSLKTTLKKKYPSLSSTTVGPEVTRPIASGIKYMTEFLKATAELGVAVLDAVSWHHYYLNGQKAVLGDFIDVNVLDQMIVEVGEYLKLVKTELPGVPMWITETGSAYDGGAPGLSETYVSGFLWLDELGVSAAMEQDIVCKQTFIGSHYAMLDAQYNPLPLYWMSLVHKQLIGERVLEVENGLSLSRTSRVYAHCTARPKHALTPTYSKGAVTLLVLNLNNNSITVSATQLQGPTHFYLLTPLKGDLTSLNMTLNDVILKYDGGLPSMKPLVLAADQDPVFPPLSYGFVVYPETKLPLCM